MTKYLIVFSAVAAMVACDTSTEGTHGNVTFTPSDCGLVGCDFDDSMGVGGTIQMNIEGLKGVSTVGATVTSEDPDLLSVVAVADVGGRPTWELWAKQAGVARLTVWTQAEDILDFIEVPIQDLDGLIMTNVLGNAVGPMDDGTYDEIWTVNADEAVSFRVTPVTGQDQPIMGKYVYTATVDQGIEDGLIEENLSEGYLYFKVPVGDYAVSFENDYGHSIDLLIRAQGQ